MTFPGLPLVGVAVECTVCGRRKSPRGRSVPLEMAADLWLREHRPLAEHWTDRLADIRKEFCG